MNKKIILNQMIVIKIIENVLYKRKVAIFENILNLKPFNKNNRFLKIIIKNSKDKIKFLMTINGMLDMNDYL